MIMVMLLLFLVIFAPVAWSDWSHHGRRPFDRVDP